MKEEVEGVTPNNVVVIVVYISRGIEGIKLNKRLLFIKNGQRFNSLTHKFANRRGKSVGFRITAVSSVSTMLWKGCRSRSSRCHEITPWTYTGI